MLKGKEDDERPRHVAVGLHDIDDVERFVRAAIHKRPGKQLDQPVEDELLSEGILAVMRLEQSYEPGFGGRDPAGSRFSGYVAKYLPGKLDDALHKLNGDTLATHTRAKCPAEGCTHAEDFDPARAQWCPVHKRELRAGDTFRRWEYAQQADSIDRITDSTESPPPRGRRRRGADTDGPLHATDELDGTLEATIDRLRTALDRQHELDRTRTLDVARMLAEDYAPADIALTLGIRGPEVTDAIDRIRRVAHIVVAN